MLASTSAVEAMTRDGIVIVDGSVVLLVELWIADVEDAKLEEDVDGEMNLYPEAPGCQGSFWVAWTP